MSKPGRSRSRWPAAIRCSPNCRPKWPPFRWASANSSWQSNDPVEALNQFQRARGILEQLAADDPSVTRYRIDLANCLDKIADIQQKTGRLAEYSRRTRTRPAACNSSSSSRCPTISTSNAPSAHTLDQLAVLLWKDGQKTEALAMSQQALARLRPAYDKSSREKSPNLADFRAALSKNYTNLAVFKRKSGKPAEAAALALEQRKLWPDDAGELYKVAVELALSAAANDAASAQPTAGAPVDRRLLIQQTIEVLQQAVAAGFDKFDELQKDQRFKILADEEAFKQLLEKRGAVK